MNYTVNISLPKALAEMAKKEVKKGYYASFSEIIRAALRNFLLQSPIPTFKMSKKAEKVALKAYDEYKEGKAIKLNSIDDLDKFV